MPKRIEPLSPLAVSKLTYATSKTTGKAYNALHPVGGVPGLLLQVTPSGAKSWIYRTLVGGKRRSIGLGPYPGLGVAEARRKALETREQIDKGVDPVESRKAARRALEAAQKAAMTFDQAAQQWLKMKSEVWTARQTKLVGEAIANHASPKIGDIPVAEIGLINIREVLEPIWLEVPTTAKALQGRLEKILGWAAVHGYRDPAAQNPAQWAGYLDQILQPIGKVKQTTGKGGGNMASVSYDEITDFVRLLRRRDGVAARALEFTILTAARTAEVIGDKRVGNPGMTWREVDLQAGLWTVPAARMKMKRDHVVVLCDRAVEILKAMPKGKPDDRIFPDRKGGIPSDGFMRSVIKRMVADEQAAGRDRFRDRQSGKVATAHGFRATFKTWSMDHTTFEREVVERALSHEESNKVVAAYDRATMIDKRKRLMQAWQQFCETGKVESDNVVAMRRAEA